MLSRNDNLLHIIRDVFGKRTSPIIYGRDTNLLKDFHSPTHGMGAVLMYSDSPHLHDEQNVHFLDIYESYTHYYRDYCDFLFSIDYRFNCIPSQVALKFKDIMKEKSSIFLINPGIWSQYFDLIASRNSILEKEVKKFSLLKNEKIFVYDNM